jgi:hypothetical protein
VSAKHVCAAGCDDEVVDGAAGLTEGGVDREYAFEKTAPVLGLRTEGCLAEDDESKLILPMSYFARRSSIPGTRRTAARSMCITAKSAVVRRHSESRRSKGDRGRKGGAAECT